MTLSILCVTMGEPHAEKFLLCMRFVARDLGAEFVIGLDGERAQHAAFRWMADRTIDLPAHDIPLQEMVSDFAVRACYGDWILRLDDDEMVSDALQAWLALRLYESGTENTYSFPRVYLYPDAQHYATSPGMFPDLQTRLGRRECMLGVDHIHAGNPHGPGKVIMAAIEHHKLLVRDYDARRAIAERYERIRPGAGTLPEYARYNLPEMFYTMLEYQEYSDGDFTAR